MEPGLIHWTNRINVSRILVYEAMTGTSMKQFKPGDRVIYRKQKTSASPGPRAQLTNPSPKGEMYSYIVEKYWVVDEVLADGSLRLRTRRGKEHVVKGDDPLLRKARWWEVWLLAGRFRSVEAPRKAPD